MHFLTRKAQDLGAISKPTNRHLVFANDLSAKTAFGTTLPLINVDISEVEDYTCELKETETEMGLERKVGTVVAEYYDENTAEVEAVDVGSGEPITILPQMFSSIEEARNAATGKETRLSLDTKNASSILKYIKRNF